MNELKPIAIITLAVFGIFAPMSDPWWLLPTLLIGGVVGSLAIALSYYAFRDFLDSRW